MNSNREAAKRAYRRLALLYHPDKSSHPEATDAFLAITRAYHQIADAAT
jgi:molecular chaperone DnaJ